MTIHCTFYHDKREANDINEIFRLINRKQADNAMVKNGKKETKNDSTETKN